jgi:DNA-binding beta-propeller fold protein YncE
MCKRLFFNGHFYIASLLLLLLANCVSSIDPASTVTDEVSGPFWPPPTQTPRIQYIGKMSGSADLGIKKTWLQNVFDKLSGGETNPIAILRPYGIFVKDDKFYVTDPGLGVLHIFDKKENKLIQIKEAGSKSLRSPIGIAVDVGGDIYIGDSYLRKVFVYDQKGKYLREIGSSDVFQRPTGISILGDKVYVVDTLGHRIIVFSKHNGTLSFAFGRNGIGPGEFNYPTNIFIGRDRHIYVMDSLNFRVQVFNEEGIYLYSFGKHGDGSGDFSKPKGIAADSEGHIYVSDADFDNVQIFDKDGKLLLIFGSTGIEKGEMSLPAGIFIDGQDIIYVADSYNRRVQIFRYLKLNNTPNPVRR